MTEKRVTVTELRELLAKLPADTEVWIDDSHRRIAAPVVDMFFLNVGEIPARVWLLIGE